MNTTKPENTAAIASKTGVAWSDWLAWLDQRGGRDLPHPEIVKLVYTRLEGKIDKPGWWAQAVTVAYEQAVGRRVPGQVADGTFQVAVNRTVVDSPQEIIAAVDAKIQKLSQVNSQKISNYRTSSTPKREYIRFDASDGSKTIIAAEPRVDKTLLNFTQEKIADAEQKEQWRKFWKGFEV